MTRDQLQEKTKRDLVVMARERGIAGAARMVKEELIAALLARESATRATPAAQTASKPRSEGRAADKPVRPQPQRAAARNTSVQTSDEEQVERSKYDVGVATKDLSARVPKDLPTGYGKDRIVLMVRDPYWLHCYWEVTGSAVQRAQAALGLEWDGAKPVLRLLDVSSRDGSHTGETIVRDIEIHGGCSNWYVEAIDPPRSFRMDIGYRSSRGRFYVIARSNVVTTPRPGASDVIDVNWADFDPRQADRIHAMSAGFDPTAGSLEIKQLFEERLRRPIGSPFVSSFGSGAYPPSGTRHFWFQLDAELIVYGATDPNARVTLQGEPVKLRPDGTFTMRFSIPDGRQVIPAVAASADGLEERTIVLAMERNTRQLEPVIFKVKSDDL